VVERLCAAVAAGGMGRDRVGLLRPTTAAATPSPLPPPLTDEYYGGEVDSHRRDPPAAVGGSRHTAAFPCARQAPRRLREGRGAVNSAKRRQSLWLGCKRTASPRGKLR
jgi:hypothetical protein